MDMLDLYETIDKLSKADRMHCYGHVLGTIVVIELYLI